MSTKLPNWTDDSPFINRTVIRSAPMNTKLGGIASNLQQITAQINGFVIKMPETFIGETQIPNKAYHDSLLWINKDGNADLISRGELVASGSIEVVPVNNASKTFSVDGNDNNHFISCDYAMPPGSTGDDAKVIVKVGRSVRDFEGNNVVVVGSIIFFTANTDAELWLEANTAEGVTILSPGTLKAFERNSSIAIVSLNETTWLMLGDIYPNEQVAP